MDQWRMGEMSRTASSSSSSSRPPRTSPSMPHRRIVRGGGFLMAVSMVVCKADIGLSSVYSAKSIKIDWPEDFGVKPQMGYLTQCTEVRSTPEGEWIVEEIKVGSDYILEERPATYFILDKSNPKRLRANNFRSLRGDVDGPSLVFDPFHELKTQVNFTHEDLQKLPQASYLLNEGKMIRRNITVLRVAHENMTEAIPFNETVERSMYIPPAIPHYRWVPKGYRYPNFDYDSVSHDSYKDPIASGESNSPSVVGSMIQSTFNVDGSMNQAASADASWEARLRIAEGPRIPHHKMCCEEFSSCCLGQIPFSLPISVWNHIKAFSDSYHVRELLDSTPRMLERHYTFYNILAKNPQGWRAFLNPNFDVGHPGKFMKQIITEGTLDGNAFFVDCVFGALTLILNALPAIEFEDGVDYAQQIFYRAASLFAWVAPHRFLANWTMPGDPVLANSKLSGQAPFAVLLGLGMWDDSGLAKTKVGNYLIEDNGLNFPESFLTTEAIFSKDRIVRGPSLFAMEQAAKKQEAPKKELHSQILAGDLDKSSADVEAGKAANQDKQIDKSMDQGRFPPTPEDKACFGTGLKIFLHATGKNMNGGLFCSAGQWGVEVLLHRYLLASTCRTEDPSEADLFFVPDYRACHYHIHPKPSGSDGLTTKGDSLFSIVIADHPGKTRDIAKADENFIDLVHRIEPWFSRKQGMDHIFAFSDQGFIVNFTHTFPSWREHIHSSIFLTTEAFTPGYGPSCFNAWKDFVIPGMLDPYRVEEIRRFNRPSEKRDLYFSFHGRTGLNHAYYTKIKVRLDIAKYFGNAKNVSIGDFTENYFDIIGRSHFCLIPEGTSAWTNHLFTAFFAGCIPIILSDRFVLPFQRHVDWKRLTIRWPQDKVSEDLYYWVVAFVQNGFETVKSTKALIDQNQCWFDWWGRFEKKRINQCSPYKAIFEDLAMRKNPPGYLHDFGWLGQSQGVDAWNHSSEGRFFA